MKLALKESFSMVSVTSLFEMPWRIAWLKLAEFGFDEDSRADSDILRLQI